MEARDLSQIYELSSHVLSKDDNYYLIVAHEQVVRTIGVDPHASTSLALKLSVGWRRERMSSRTLLVLATDISDASDADRREVAGMASW